MNYAGLFEFTDAGLKLFQQVVAGAHGEDAFPLDNENFVTRIPGTKPFEVVDFDSARDMAAAIIESAATLSIPALLPRTGLWAWLTFVMRDTLFPKDAAGRRKFGEVHRWLPSDPNDWQKAQRHLVRMPVLLLSTLGSEADHLLCTKPGILPEIREQLTSQQDMFHPAFQSVARALYFDGSSRRLKRGAGGKAGGSPRRLAKVRLQLDVTWDLFDLTPERLLVLLPKEFDRYRAVSA